MNVGGAWNGTGSDSQGPFTLAWVLTQTGNVVSGSALTKPVSTTDGTCASCHKNKIGTLSGTVSGSVFAFTMSFPAGSGGEPTPICSVSMNGTTASLTASATSANYTGADSCEGPFTGGTISMTR